MRNSWLIGWAAIFLCASLVSPGYAQLQALPDETMAQVVGQSGIAISTDHLDFDLHAGTIYYGDSDGLGPSSGTGPGYISLTGVSLKGSVSFGTPMTLAIATSLDPAKGIQVDNLLLKMNDMTLTIPTFTIDAIRIGSAPGEGGSLGSFGIENMTLQMTGTITLSMN
jgi:hypothetical protein